MTGGLWGGAEDHCYSVTFQLARGGIKLSAEGEGLAVARTIIE